MEIIEILKNASKIAIVGLSPDPSKDSHTVGAYLQKMGYEIYPIYPKEDEILGRKVYRSVSELPTNVDIVVMFRKSNVAMDIIGDVIKNKAKTFWLQIGIENDEAKQIAEQNGMTFIQNKCIMVEHKFSNLGVK